MIINECVCVYSNVDDRREQKMIEKGTRRVHYDYY